MFDFGNGDMGEVDIETVVRTAYFERVGIHPVHHDMDVRIHRVLVLNIERLMTFQFHASEKIFNGKVQLVRRGLFRILPTQYPVCDWHPALYGLLGKGDHRVFLSGSSRCEEVQCAVMGEPLPFQIVMLSVRDVTGLPPKQSRRIYSETEIPAASAWLASRSFSSALSRRVRRHAKRARLSLLSFMLSSFLESVRSEAPNALESIRTEMSLPPAGSSK